MCTSGSINVVDRLIDVHLAEPGYYEVSSFGIRLETLVTVVNATTPVTIGYIYCSTCSLQVLIWSDLYIKNGADSRRSSFRITYFHGIAFDRPSLLWYAILCFNCQ